MAEFRRAAASGLCMSLIYCVTLDKSLSLSGPWSPNYINDRWDQVAQRTPPFHNYWKEITEDQRETGPCSIFHHDFLTLLLEFTQITDSDWVIPCRARSWSSFSKFWCRRIERIRSSAMKESRYGWFLDNSQERDYHQYFQLSTENTFWKLKTGVAAVLLKLSSFQGVSHFYAISERPATVPTPRP